MSCLSNEEVIDALIDLVASDLNQASIAEAKKPFVLEEYVNKIYSFVKEHSADEATAVTAAAMTPIVIDRILSMRTLPGQLTDKLSSIPGNEDLRTDVLQLIKKFKDIGNVRETLGLTRNPAEGLGSAKEVIENPPPPPPPSPEKPEVEMAKKIINFGVFVSYGPEADMVEGRLKARFGQKRNANALRTIEEMLDEQIATQAIEDSGQMNVPGIGPVFLKIQHAINISPEIRNELGSGFFFDKNELMAVLVDANGNAVKFSEEGVLDPSGKPVAYKLLSAAPLKNGKLITDPEGADFKAYVKQKGITGIQYALAAQVVKNLGQKVKALGAGKLEGINNITTALRQKAEQEAIDELSKDYEAYSQMREYLIKNPNAFVNSTITGVSKGFIVQNEWNPTRLSEVNFETEFNPTITKKEQESGSDYIQGVTYFEYPGVETPIAIFQPTYSEVPQLLNNIISLFTDELYEVVDGKKLPILASERQRLINQFLVSKAAGVRFNFEKVNDEEVYVNAQGEHSIAIAGTIYKIKFDLAGLSAEEKTKALEKRKELADKIREHLTKPYALADEKGLALNNKDFNSQSKAEKIEREYGATIITDISQGNRSTIYKKVREGGANFYKVTSLLVPINGRLLNSKYDKPTIIQDKDGNFILSLDSDASYNDFLKENFLTPALINPQTKKIDKVNPVLSYTPTPEDAVKFLAPEKKEQGTVTPENKASSTPLDESYKGKLVFITPGSGKTAVAKNNDNVVDADDITMNVIKQLAPTFPFDYNQHPSQNIYDAIAHFGVDKKVLYTTVKKIIDNLKAEGKTVLTGSYNLVDSADVIFVQKNPDILKTRLEQGYDQSKEFEAIGSKPFTEITQYATDVLSKPAENQISKPEKKEEKKEEPKTNKPATGPNLGDMSADDILGAMGDIQIDKSGRQKSKNKAISLEDLEAALDWFKNSPVGKKFPFKIETILAAVNSQNGPAARWAINGVTIFQYITQGKIDTTKSGDYTDLYHEAWHGFTQTFLTEKQRTDLYAEMRKRKGSFEDYEGNVVTYKNASVWQLEEQMAEEFREYAIAMNRNKSVSKELGTKQKSIFRQILDWLTSFFSKAKPAEVIADPLNYGPVAEIYNKLYKGNISNYNFNLDNRDKSIGALFKNFVAKTPKEGTPQALNYEMSNLLARTADSIISSLAKKLNGQKNTRKYTAQVLGNPELRKHAFNYVYATFKNTIVPRLNAQKEAAQGEFEKNQIQQYIDTIQYAIDNFGDRETLSNNKQGKDFISYYISRSPLISDEARKSALEDEDFSEIDETKQMTETKEQLGSEDGNAKSSYTSAPAEIKYLLSSIPKFKEDGTPDINIFGEPDLEDSYVVWNRIAKTLTGKMDKISMYNAMEKAAYEKDKNNNIVSVKDPILAEIVERLGPPNTTTLSETMLWGKFYNTYNKAFIPLIQATVTKKTTKFQQGEISEYNMTLGAANSSGRRVVNLWSNQFKSLNSDYILTNLDPTDLKLQNQNYLDVNKLLSDFTAPDGKLKAGEGFNFFRALGLNLTNNKIIRDAINNDKVGSPAIIFNRLKTLRDSHKISRIYSLDDIFKAYPESSTNAKDELADDGNNLTVIANLEMKNGDYTANYMVTNAEGNTQFEQSMHNTISIMVQTINDAVDIKDANGKVIQTGYKALMDLPHMADINININPQAAYSIWLNSIFKIRDDKGNLIDQNSPEFGQRRTLEDGKPVMLNLNNLSGVQMIGEGANDGISSASADEFTKLIMDFHLTNEIMRPELMRHADKGTSFSVWLDFINTDSTSKKLYVDVVKLFDRPTSDPTIKKVPGYDQVVKIMNGYLKAEMERINRLKKMQDDLANGKKIAYDANYLKEGQNFLVFEDILSLNVREELKKYKTLDEAVQARPELQADISRQIKAYFENQVDKVSNQMGKANWINPSLLQATKVKAAQDEIRNANNDLAKRALTRSFVINNWIHNYESTAIIYGDIAQYNMKKEEFHKRNAGFGSTGPILATDRDTINFVNSRGRGWAKKQKYKEKVLASDGSVQSAVFADNKIPSAYMKQLAEAMINKEAERMSRDEAERKVLGYDEKTGVVGTYDKVYDNGSIAPYFSMTEGDAQGWITFDFYRAASILDSTWTNAQEQMYNDIIEDKYTGDPSKIMEFFPVKKYQYAGILKTQEGQLPLKAFHKFSLLPLIPNLVKGTNLENLHNKMMDKGIDYALFKSGSKISTVTNLSKKGDAIQDRFYKEGKENERAFDFEGSMVENTVYLQFMKNQLEIAPHFKGSVTIPTQMRKLIENGIMEGGVPTDFRPEIKDLNERIKAWSQLKDEGSRRKESAYYGLVLDYEGDLADLTELKKKKLEKEAGIERKNGKIVFNKQLQDFLIRELDRQDLGEHEKAYIRMAKGGNKLANDLSLSLSSEKLEKALTSIVMKRLVRQKINGEALIQVSGAGFEKTTLTGRLSEEDKIKYGTNQLRFYRQGEGPGGRTAAMQVKIALQGDFLKLLNLKHNDGKKIGSRDRLNQMLQNEEWLNKGDHRQMITITGPRIPTQENNSMEFAEVFEFLDPSAGNIVVLPSEIVAKSGGDFDIDKITFMFPNLKSRVIYDSAETKAIIKELAIEFPELGEKGLEEITKKKKKDLTENEKLALDKLRNLAEKEVTIPMDRESEEGLENRLMNNMVKILSLKESYVSLIRPNGTDIVKPVADELAKDVMEYNPKDRMYPEGAPSRIAGTRVFEIQYNLYKHGSNNIGKQTLGLGAVDNTYNTVFNRIGARMNAQYTTLGGIVKRADILLEHNKLKDEQGKDVISLAHLYDATGQTSISSVIAQLINGWVDIAKDAWIFNVQGNKEIAPTMLFMVQAGVPFELAAYYVSHPIIRKYVEEQKKAKSTFAEPLGTSGGNPMFYKNTAREVIFQELYQSEETPFSDFKTRDAWLNQRTLELTDRKSGKAIDFFKPKEIKQNLKNRIKEYKDVTSKGQNFQFNESDEAVFLHFLELEELSKGVRDIKLNTNVDTSVTNSLFEAETKLLSIESLEASTMFPTSVIEAIKKESPISSFFVQDFQIEFLKDLFPLKTDETINAFIREKMRMKKAFKNDVDSTFGDNEKFITNLRSDLPSFIFQNSLRAFDIESPTYKGVEKNTQYTVKTLPNLRYGVFVKTDPETNKEIIYLDKSKLESDYKNRANASYKVALADGTTIDIPIPNPTFFKTPESYYKFVFERELLRNTYKGIAGWTLLQDRVPVKNKLENYLKSKPREIINGVQESDERFNSRINTIVYEETLIDMALDNSFNEAKMFQSRESVADQLVQLQIQYPELMKNYSLVKNLSANILQEGVTRVANIMMNDSLLDGNKINIFHENLNDLSDPAKIKIDTTNAQERLRVANFFKNLSMVAFLQSGMNTKGQFSLTRIVPQEQFTALMSNYVPEFLKDINPITLERYYQKFVETNNYRNSKLRSRLKNYTINNYNPKADKQSDVGMDMKDLTTFVLKTSGEKAYSKENDNSVSKITFTTDNLGNTIYDPSDLGPSSAVTVLTNNQDKNFIVNGVAYDQNGNILDRGANTNDAALYGASSNFGNVIPIPTRMSFGQVSSAQIADVEVGTTRKVVDIVEEEPVENPPVTGETIQDDYKYYGAMYKITVANGKGIDVNIKKGVSESGPKYQARKQKILDMYNANPNVDGGTGIAFRSSQSTPINPNTGPQQSNFSMKFSDGTTIPTAFKLNDQQTQALLDLEKFYKNPDKYNNNVTLIGYAGTGKTTIIQIFHKYLEQKHRKTIKYSSPTHRANAVTKLKNPSAQVYTLHALFGLQGKLNLEDGKYDLSKLEFAAKGGEKKRKIQKGDILVVDEASMVNNALYDFLEDNKEKLELKIIYMGDPAQLKPVGQEELSKTLLSGTKFELTKVERTGDNPILEESTNLRNDKDFNYQTKIVNGQGVTYTNSESDVNDIIKENFSNKEFEDNKLSFRIIGATNDSVTDMNNKVRSAIYGKEAENQLLPGEIIMGYNNFDINFYTKQPKIINSGDYQVVDLSKGTKVIEIGEGADTQKLVFTGYNVILRNLLSDSQDTEDIFVADLNLDLDVVRKYVAEIEKINFKANAFLKKGDARMAAKFFEDARSLEAQVAFMRNYKNKAGELKLKKTIDYGYAHTIHKSQGGTYNKVLILADTINSFQEKDSKQQLKYVAMSRAVNNVFVYTKHKLAEPQVTGEPSSNVSQPGASTIESTESVYAKLGDKTQSENVLLPKDLEDNTTYTNKNFWDKIVPEARVMYDNKVDRKTGELKSMLIAYRGNSKKTFLQNYKDGNTVGNPFNWQDQKTDRKEAGIKTTKMFIEWLITGNNFNEKNATEEYRQAIINDIKSGKIKNSPILYYEEKGYATHATALDYLINKYDWSKPTTQPSTQTTTDKFAKKNIFTVTPQGGVSDNKAKAKASIATQYIGFGEDIAGSDGKRSSTQIYREQAGALANTGNYSNNDVIFVSIPGKRGNEEIAKREQDKTIKEALKAIEAGATLITDNKAYIDSSNYNTGEKRLYKNMESKGYQYSEITVDGQKLGVWSKPSLLVGGTSPVVQKRSVTTREVVAGQDDSKTYRTINGRTVDPNIAQQIDKVVDSIAASVSPDRENVFPVGGFGQYMIGADEVTGQLKNGKITPIAPATFVYLSEQLWRKLGYINPNFDLVLSTYGLPNVLQEGAEVTDLDVLETLSFCFSKT